MSIKTEREFMMKVLALNIESADGTDIKEYARQAITKLDERNEKRKNTPTKAQKENMEIENAILEQLSKGAMLSTDLATALRLSTQKVNGVAGNLEKRKAIIAEKVKIKGVGERTRYSLANKTAEGDTEMAE